MASTETYDPNSKTEDEKGPSQPNYELVEYKSESLNNPDDFIKAARMIIKISGKVYITLELSSDGKSGEMRMWSEEPKVNPVNPYEAIHYSPSGGNGSKIFLATCNPDNYEEVRKELISYQSPFRGRGYKLTKISEFDLTSGSGDVNGKDIEKRGQRAIKSTLVKIEAAS